LVQCRGEERSVNNVAGELRDLFLFESLTDAQLDVLARAGDVVDVSAGPLFAEGETARYLYVLVDGEIALSKRSGKTDVETVRTTRSGVYFGAWSAFLEAEQTYETSARAVSPSRLFVIEARSIGGFLRAEFPMACHFLVGATMGRFNLNRMVDPHDRMVQIGHLTAGLTHELNNPAAAAVRAVSLLRGRIAGMRRRLLTLTDGTISRAAVHALVAFQDEVVQTVVAGQARAALQKSDAEDEIGDWLAEQRISTSWDVASCLAEAGLDVEWLETARTTVVDAGAPTALAGVVEWLHDSVDTELLLDEIHEAAQRISSLVVLAKEYSRLDRAGFDVADVNALLSNTVEILSHRLADITVVRDFDASLPPLSCWPAELNQVWTNLIENAVTAIRRHSEVGGTLVLRSERRDELVRVEICDTGVGVPEELRRRIFDPFFTTKAVGEGKGLGLDVAARIIDKHGGNLWVESNPGDTRFIAVWPIDGPRDG
jgi:signal transduction histidine kinase